MKSLSLLFDALKVVETIDMEVWEAAASEEEGHWRPGVSTPRNLAPVWTYPSEHFLMELFWNTHSADHY